MAETLLNPDLPWVIESEALPLREGTEWLTSYAYEALFDGDVDTFLQYYNEVQTQMRAKTLVLNDISIASRACLWLGFVGSQGDTGRNAAYIWFHERAHQKVLQHFYPGVSSTIRIAEYQLKEGEDRQLRYQGYFDVSLPELIVATKNDVVEVTWLMGRLLLGPEREGCGYKEETDLAYRLLAQAERLRMPAAFGKAFIMGGGK